MSGYMFLDLCTLGFRQETGIARQDIERVQAGTLAIFRFYAPLWEFQYLDSISDEGEERWEKIENGVTPL